MDDFRVRLCLDGFQSALHQPDLALFDLRKLFCVVSTQVSELMNLIRPACSFEDDRTMSIGVLVSVSFLASAHTDLTFFWLQ